MFAKGSQIEKLTCIFHFIIVHLSIVTCIFHFSFYNFSFNFSWGSNGQIVKHFLVIPPTLFK